MSWHRRFFVLFLVFLPTQLGYHFWPQWAMVLGRRVDYLSPTLYLTDILVFFTLFFWLLGEIVKIKNKKSKIQIKYQKLLTLSATLLVVFFNVVVAANPYVAMYKWLKVMEFTALGWYIVRTKPTLATIVTPLSIGVLYSSILAIVQFVLQHSIGGPLWWLGERTFTVDTPGIARIPLHLEFGIWNLEFGLRMRPYATFPHPNVLGGFLAAVLPLVTLRYLGSLGYLRKKTKIYYGFVLLTGVVALLLTFSRSAIVVGAVAIAVAIARIRNYELGIMKGLRFVAVAFIGIFVLFLTSYFILHNSTDESIVVRVALNDAAMRLWRSAPLFGVGLGNFLVKLPEVLPARTIYFLQPVHNIYLLLLSEIGAVGVAGVVGVVWVAIRKNKRILFVPLIAYLLLGFVDHYPLTLQQGQLLLTILAAMSISSIH